MTRRTSVDSFRKAWSKLGALYPPASWFRDEHLAENRNRIERILCDIQRLVRPGPDVRVIDVGCFNGFLCYLLHQYGYQTAGTDALPDSAVPERQELMASLNAPYYPGNFNQPNPFPDCPRQHYSAAILGEVFEHILYHPVGFLQQIGALLTPGGILILTTPNPYTLANAVRMLRGRGFIWGDTEFATFPKIDSRGHMITHEQVHYREYSREVLVDAIQRAGFKVLETRYIGPSVHAKQPLLTRFIKRLPFWPWLQSTRLFGSGHYIVAQWQPEGSSAT